LTTPASELVAKVELSTFAVACRHQQEMSEKLYFRGFSGELRTVFRKTSVGPLNFEHSNLDP
jgi:hypothetical protein